MNNTKDLPIALIAPFNIDFGIRYISSFLKTKGYFTYVISFNQIRYTIEFLDNDYFTAPLLKHKICPEEDLRLLINLLKRLKPKLVGISVASATMKTAQRITSEIKKELDVIVVWGGIHAIIAPEECIQYTDIVCIGEGEIAMWELVEKLKDKQPLTGIRNLWIKNSTGGIEKNEVRPLIEDLDGLPLPDFIGGGNKFLIDSGKIVEDPHIISGQVKNQYPIMTSRGCMFNCAFCCNSVIKERYKGKGPYLRRRSVSNVIEELRFAIENKPIYAIRFWDDIFTYDKNWIKEFCSRYLAEIGKPFVCYANPRYTDRDILTELAKVGLISVFVGIQSGSETVNREVFARSHSNQDILNFSKTMKELHILPRYDLISDNPYETEQDQDNTVGLLLKLPHPYRIQIYSLSYFPETPLTKRALNDKVIATQDLEQHSSKTINHYNMFLPLSKNKEQLFWNCIKAMAVNKHFPKGIVGLCKSSGFLRKHPQILGLLGRYYLRLFKPMGVKKPAILATPILANLDFERYVAFGKANFLFYKEKLNFSIFPLGNIDRGKRFCLRIINRLKENLFMQFSIELLPLTATKTAIGIIWKAGLEVKANFQTDVYLDLAFPNLYFSFNGYKEELKLYKKARFRPEDGNLYIMIVNWRLPNTGKYKRVGIILCNI